MDKVFLLQRSTPEAQGVHSEHILKFIDRAEQLRTGNMDQDFHSFMLLRHGYVIAEGWWKPYEKEHNHMLFSLSKSFTSTAVGFAVQEGLLTVNDCVVTYFPEECQNPGELLSKMQILHLLSMSTGHVADTHPFFLQREDGNWAKAFFEVPVEKEPGTHFLYNTGATYMLSVILQRVTGRKLIDYLKPRLFEPLGIESPTWETCPRGYNTGGYGLKVRTEYIAKFGQLYLNKGSLDGRQYLTPEWIHEATSIQSDNFKGEADSDWQQGYGYQFWRCRHNAYRGDGAFGQYCVVMPEQDMLLAVTGGMSNLQKPLEILWDEILPKVEDKVLPDSPEYDRLIRKLSELELLRPAGKNNPVLEARLEGKAYQLEENEEHINKISFKFKKDSAALVYERNGKQNILEAGIGRWISGTFFFNRQQEYCETAGSWQEDRTLLIQSRFVEMPFALELKIRFEDDKLDKLSLETKLNVSFTGPVTGRIAGMAVSE